MVSQTEVDSDKDDESKGAGGKEGTVGAEDIFGDDLSIRYFLNVFCTPT